MPDNKKIEQLQIDLKNANNEFKKLQQESFGIQWI